VAAKRKLFLERGAGRQKGRKTSRLKCATWKGGNGGVGEEGKDLYLRPEIYRSRVEARYERRSSFYKDKNREVGLNQPQGQ